MLGEKRRIERILAKSLVASTHTLRGGMYTTADLIASALPGSIGMDRTVLLVGRDIVVMLVVAAPTVPAIGAVLSLGTFDSLDSMGILALVAFGTSNGSVDEGASAWSSSRVVGKRTFRAVLALRAVSARHVHACADEGTMS